MDAGFTGYDLLRQAARGGRRVLLRVGSNVSLLTRLGCVDREGDQTGYLWPGNRRSKAPLVLRLIRAAAAGKKKPVWLPTDVADAGRLAAATAARLYALRWGVGRRSLPVEVFSRSVKQARRRRKACSAAPAQARLERHWAVIGLWLAGLMTVDAVVKAGHDPLSWSPAAALRALRRAARPGGGRRRGRAVAAELAGARKDTYERAGSKRAHRWPHKKKDKPPGDPKLRPATTQEVAKAQRVYDRKRAA